MKQFLLAMCLLGAVAAQDAQKPEVKPAAPAPLKPEAQLSEVQKLRVVASFQKAQMAQLAAQKAADQFYQTCATEARAAGAAEGTQCVVNTDSNEVFLREPTKQPPIITGAPPAKP